MSDLFDENRPS